MVSFNKNSDHLGINIRQGLTGLRAHNCLYLVLFLCWCPSLPPPSLSKLTEDHEL